MINTFWREFRKYHARKTFTPEHVVDYIAVFDILRLCASGVNNFEIAEMFNVEAYYVKETLLEFLDFPGFRKGLSFSPWRFYKVVKEDKKKFTRNILGAFPENSPEAIEALWNLCEATRKIEKEIEKYE